MWSAGRRSDDHVDGRGPLFAPWAWPATEGAGRHGGPPLCAGCRAEEARYGFRDEDTLEAPRTLCFECFRLAMEHRRERMAQQLDLPFPARLREADLRRRRAQIAVGVLKVRLRATCQSCL